MHTYTIQRKMSGTGSIHDIASDLVDRPIKFGAGEEYAVVGACADGAFYFTATVNVWLYESLKVY